MGKKYTMKISNKAIVGSIGCIVIGLVSYLLHDADCLLALIFILFLVDGIED